MKNCKVPGPDTLQGYWIKVFASSYERIAIELQLCLEVNESPEWLTTGRTKDQFLIDKMILGNCGKRLTELRMKWKD